MFVCVRLWVFDAKTAMFWIDRSVDPFAERMPTPRKAKAKKKSKFADTDTEESDVEMEDELSESREYSNSAARVLLLCCVSAW